MTGFEPATPSPQGWALLLKPGYHLLYRIQVPRSIGVCRIWSH
ncbi:MAG: hypothetical protein ACRC8A_09830 [Microcoleaceae cyanobacterium]